MSTSDARASSVILAYRQAVGPLVGRMLSYNANFTSTGGNLSAQFGAHVLQLEESAGASTLYGAAATGAAVWSVPLTQRFDNGVPKAALIIYAGGAPTAAVSGKRNFLNVPIGFGLGAALSPAPWISITPWYEAAPGLDLDTTIKEPDLSDYAPNDGDIQQLINGQEAVLFSEDDLKQVIADSVQVDVAFEMAMRAGLDVTLRMSESWSFNVNSYLTTLGSGFGGETFLYLGGGLVFHWDDIVPAVLPASRRLERESCEDIEERFRMCPAAKSFGSRAGVNAAPEPANMSRESAVAPTVGVRNVPPINPAPVNPPSTLETTPSDTAAPPPVLPSSSTIPPQSPAPVPEAPSGGEHSIPDNSPPSTTFPQAPAAPPANNALPSVTAPY